MNDYLAILAVLILVNFGRLEDGIPIKDVVETVTLPGMGTGVGRVPSHIFAGQMKAAIEDILEERHGFLPSWHEAQRRHQLPYSDSSLPGSIPPPR